MDLRDGFKAIADGWMLVDDFDELTDRIEAVGIWARTNGPLLPDEESTVRMMIETQVAKGISRGDFEPFIPGDRPAILKAIMRLQAMYAIKFGKMPDGLFIPANRADELCALAQFMLANSGSPTVGRDGNLPDGLVIDSVMGMRVRLCTGEQMGVGQVVVTGPTPEQMAIWTGDFHDRD